LTCHSILSLFVFSKEQLLPGVCLSEILLVNMSTTTNETNKREAVDVEPLGDTHKETEGAGKKKKRKKAKQPIEADVHTWSLDEAADQDAGEASESGRMADVCSPSRTDKALQEESMGNRFRFFNFMACHL
jgi:hypothetical protein